MEKDLPYFKTLHSIAFKKGGYTKYNVIAKKDYKIFSDAMGMKFTGYYTEDFFHNDDRYLFLNFLERNNPKMFELYIDSIDIKKYNDVKHNYERYKAFAGVIDFTDMLEEFIKSGSPLPVKVAIIDEAQDLTTLQWEMCQVAFRDCERVYIAGDDDQAIYEWNGADINTFLGIKADQTILDKSYRLKTNILNFSKNISKIIKHRVDKDFEPLDDGGSIHFLNTLEELELKDDESYYFLARNNYFLKYYTDELRKGGHPYWHKDKFSINPKHIKVIKAFEKLRQHKTLTDSEELFLRPYFNSTVDLKLPWFNNLNFDINESLYYRDLIRLKKLHLTESKLLVSTIHGVKGGEADNVVLMLDFTKSVKENFDKSPDSELRCLYVACTRAKNNLYIIHSQTKNGYDKYLNFKEL